MRVESNALWAVVEGLPFPLRRLLLDVDQRPRRAGAHHAEGNCRSALPGA
jgi:hypothetical protein